MLTLSNSVTQWVTLITSRASCDAKYMCVFKLKLRRYLQALGHTMQWCWCWAMEHGVHRTGDDGESDGDKKEGNGVLWSLKLAEVEEKEEEILTSNFELIGTKCNKWHSQNRSLPRSVIYAFTQTEIECQGVSGQAWRINCNVHKGVSCIGDKFRCLSECVSGCIKVGCVTPICREVC